MGRVMRGDAGKGKRKDEATCFSVAASSRNTRLVCQLKRSVRKRPGVPGQQTHIDRIGPAVSRAVEEITRAHDCETAPSASLNCASLTTSGRIVRYLGIYGEPFSLHYRYSPLLERIVGGLNPVLTPRRTDIRAEEDPCVCALDQVRATLYVRFDSQKSEFMTTQCNEQTVPRRRGCSEHPDGFQPTHKTAALLTYGLPPGAARSH